jgi:hypothetical protein
MITVDELKQVFDNHGDEVSKKDENLWLEIMKEVD